jgi:protein phosphatase
MSLPSDEEYRSQKAISFSQLHCSPTFHICTMSNSELAPVLDSLTALISRALTDYSTSQPSTLSLPPIDPTIAKSICDSASRSFSAEPMLLDLTGQFFIIGDLHGHLLEFLRILSKFGLPPNTKYLLLGDVVDRGDFSLHTALYVLLLKALFPASFFVIRGNHESPDVNSTHGLLTEVMEIYRSNDLFLAINRAFAAMPLAARVNGDMLCVHAGIGPRLDTLDQIAGVQRPPRAVDIEVQDAVTWSDLSLDGRTARGRGGLFGEALVSDFLDRNRLRLLVRGHSAIRGGIEYRFSEKVVTVFSISRYCDQIPGVAGVLEVCEGRREVAHLLSALPFVRRKQIAPVVPPSARILSLTPGKAAAAGQPPIVAGEFMRKRGRNRNL